MSSGASLGAFSWKHCDVLAIIEALIAGLFIGSVLGFVGAGGAMVSVPILLYIFHFTNNQATVAALVIVAAAAASGLIPKLKTREVLIREALIIWGIGLITTLSMTALAPHLPENFIHVGFAMVLVAAGASMLRKPLTLHPEKQISPLWLVGISLAVGTMTGLFGVGGGFLAIPILVLFFHTPLNKAAGTSLLIIAMNSATSFIERFSSWHTITWKIPIIISITAIAMSRYASAKSPNVNVKALRRAFAFLLFSLALFTLWKIGHTTSAK